MTLFSGFQCTGLVKTRVWLPHTHFWTRGKVQSFSLLRNEASDRLASGQGSRVLEARFILFLWQELLLQMTDRHYVRPP
jgi:hypothetical protein